MADLTAMLQAAAGAAGGDANYIEDVFSTYLYTGNGSTQTITNGIDLSGSGGLVWLKSRSNAENNILSDTVRGTPYWLVTNSTSAQDTNSPNLINAFNNNGFGLGVGYTGINGSGESLVSWTFREQPKFFDIVTWTDNGASSRTLAHNLGSVPGCIIVKAATGTSSWYVYHRSSAASGFTPQECYVRLNATSAVTDSAGIWNNTAPTSTDFTVGSQFQGGGITYIAYLFAHDAGGFGLAGTDNVISCGSYTGNGSTTGPVVTLGYEPQWIMLKNASAVTDWVILDTMRGLVVGGPDSELNPNQSAAESSATYITPTATGFQLNTTNGAYNASGNTFIYIAIRRGPMAVPTLGTSVFSPIASSASTGTIQTTGFPVDMQIAAYRPGDSENSTVNDRLRGVSSTAADKIVTLKTSATTAESIVNGIQSYNWGNTGFGIPSYLSSSSGIYWNFSRAPGFFDEVCYTGTGVARTITHNLAAVPELMIVKKRDAAASWTVYSKSIPITHTLILNNGTASAASAVWNSTAPTSSVFSVSALGAVNGSGNTYVNYLFATCDGVSKVGSYTGNGTTQTINCGFTGGARFVLLKRTDDVGDWYVYDTARGMTVLTDPYLWLNSTAAEVATLGSVTSVATGFALDSAVTPDINTNSGTYIFLAIA